MRQDVKLARNVMSRDDAIDNLNRRIFDKMVVTMQEDKDKVKRAIALVNCSRALERIADHATNVAEDVIFMAEGEIIRHRDETIEE